ncbi:MAG: hypothetical protein NTZ09_12240 [Candidatus Hydrogenedentes bacterium]|nr:hypothetical protein [Candidatus Hydrogenedentota bacterium]
MSKRQAAVRLQFDAELQASLRRINRPRRSLLPHVGFVACVAAVVVLALGGGQYVPWPSWPGGNGPAVARTCLAVADAMKTGKLAALDRFCADGETGKRLLATDNQRLVSGSAVHAAAFGKETTAGMSCFDFLKNARQQLTDQRVELGQITPLAFGGVEAKVLDPATMSNPAVSVMGELYFQAGAKLYALELTARKCGDDFVVTSFWRCQPVDVAAEDLKARARDKYPQEETAATDANTVKITSIRRIFIPLPANP